MRALVLFSHPKQDSFSAAVRNLVLEKLRDAGAEARLRDLYAEGFQPVLTAEDWDDYEDEAINTKRVQSHVADLQWCDTLIFIYPTWWYGVPAMLKGWLDRVLVPGVAFAMPEPGKEIRPHLSNITRFGVFTTCGASFWLTGLIGAPGKRLLMRGVRILCNRRCRTVFAAHYLMDSSTEASRKAHLVRVAKRMDKLIGFTPAPEPKAAPAC